MAEPSLIWRAVGAQCLAAGSVGLVELLVEGSRPWSAILCATGLGLLVGVAVGAVVAFLLALLRASPLLARWGGALYGVAVGVALSDHMGIAAALGGHARRLAVTAFVVTIFGAVALAVLVMTLAPTPRYPHGWLVVRARVVSGPLLSVALLLLVGTRLWVPAHYRSVDDVGACAAAMIAGIALQAALGTRALPSRILRFAVPGSVLLLTFTTVTLARPEGAVLVALDAAELPRIGLAALRRVSDVDGDGYSALFGGGDCDPWNVRVHPRAQEIPGNGVDDNCRFGDAPMPRLRDPELAAAASPSPVSVVLLTIDTLRRDRVGQRSSGPSLTPNLDAWASGARAFDHAYSASTRTCSSLAALQYGAFPLELSWVDAGSSSAVRRLQQRLPDAMLHVPWMCVTGDGVAPRRKPLAALLRDRGMATAAIVDDSLTFLLQRELFGEGFEEYEDEGHLVDEPAIARAVSVLETLASGPRRFFLWVHVFGPHDRGETDSARDLAREYDADVLRSDRALAPLFHAMDAVSRRTPLAALVVSDHGELFGPRGRWHGTDLSEDLLRVPLLIRAPGLPPGPSVVLASTVDILPTCLALTETPAPAGLAGTNLAADEHGLPHRVLFSDVWNRSVGYSLTAAYDGRHKLLYNHLLGTYEPSSQTSAEGSTAAISALRSALDGYLHDNEVHLSE